MRTFVRNGGIRGFKRGFGEQRFDGFRLYAGEKIPRVKGTAVFALELQKFRVRRVVHTHIHAVDVAGGEAKRGFLRVHRLGKGVEGKFLLQDVFGYFAAAFGIVIVSQFFAEAGNFKRFFTVSVWKEKIRRFEGRIGTAVAGVRRGHIPL